MDGFALFAPLTVVVPGAGASWSRVAAPDENSVLAFLGSREAQFNAFTFRLEPEIHLMELADTVRVEVRVQ
jgi:hypothetical protein